MLETNRRVSKAHMEKGALVSQSYRALGRQSPVLLGYTATENRKVSSKTQRCSQTRQIKDVSKRTPQERIS